MMQDFHNRLEKNFRHKKKQATRENLQAWRLYDKDVPQYPLVIDLYGEHVHLQEYDTGWKLTESAYEIWLFNVMQVVSQVTGVEVARIHFKKRQRQRQSEQYTPTGNRGDSFVVHENGRQFWVNLDKYLDTGLFLDHRNTRQKVGEMAKGKRFLNLFAYTGSFTVYAATGGAVYSETVDLSNTYLSWARDNFVLNHIDLAQHHLIRSDVFRYLDEAVNSTKLRFDLIVMDPPSFSNSKKMLEILDVQRDHSRLIHQAMKLLNPEGVLFFSNNLQSFSLDATLGQPYLVREISHRSVPWDFRQTKIHRCWEIQHPC